MDKVNHKSQRGMTNIKMLLMTLIMSFSAMALVGCNWSESSSGKTSFEENGEQVDLVSPYLQNVSGIIDLTADTAVINGDKSVIELTFSEVINWPTPLNVDVKKQGAILDRATDFVVAGNQNKLTVTLTNPLVAGDAVDILVMQRDINNAKGTAVDVNEDIKFALIEEHSSVKYFTVKLKYFIGLNNEDQNDEGNEVAAPYIKKVVDVAEGVNGRGLLSRNHGGEEITLQFSREVASTLTNDVIKVYSLTREKYLTIDFLKTGLDANQTDFTVTLVNSDKLQKGEQIDVLLLKTDLKGVAGQKEVTAGPSSNDTVTFDAIEVRSGANYLVIKLQAFLEAGSNEVVPEREEPAPFITEINDIIDLSKDRGVLASGSSANTITVKLSEAVANVAVNSVSVFSEMRNRNLVINTVATAGDTVTITLTENLLAGEAVNVYLLKSGVKNLAGEVIVTQPAFTDDQVRFDAEEAVFGVDYVVIKLQSFKGITAISPIGTIRGFLFDSASNKVPNATISVAGKSVTSDGNGMFTIEDIEASVANTFVFGQPNPTFKVTIAPVAPLNAVTAAIMVDASGLTDGFDKDLGIIVLPLVNTTINGVFRDEASLGPVAGVCAIARMIAGPTANVIYSVLNSSSAVTTVTGAATDGTFAISALPSNSQYELLISDDCNNIGSADWTLATTQFTTPDQGQTLNLGDVLLTAKLGVDDVAPFISSVDAVVNPQAEIGVLARNTDGTAGISLNLSEAVKAAAINATTVRVFSETRNSYLAGADYSVALVNAGDREIKVTLTNALSEGEKFFIQLSINDVQDLAGNSLALSSTIGFNELVQLNGMDYLRVHLQAFKDAAPVAGVGRFDQEFVDGAEFAHLTGYAALQDNNAYGGVITQLNGANENMQADAAERLSSLVKGITPTGNDVAPEEVLTNIARLSFDPTEIGEFHIELLDQAGNNRPVSIITDVQVDDTFDAVIENDDMLAKVNVANNNTTHFLLKDVQVGWTVKLRRGETGAWAEVSLEDQVPPTPVLQRAYGYCDYNVLGEGGELATVNGNSYPRLCVTPMLFAPYTGVSPRAVEKERALNALYLGRAHGIKVDGTFEQEPLGGIEAAYYDALAYARWSAGGDSFKRTVGVAMSENVKLSADPAYSGANATITGYRASNDVIVDDNGEATNADLVIFNVDNVLKLAADDGAEMNFQDVLTDNAANKADAHAKVIIADRMPPLVTDVAYDGATANRTLTVTFNEPVKMAMGEYLEFENFIVTARTDKDSTDEAKGGIAANDRTLVFTVNEIAGGIAPVFGNTVTTKTFMAADGSNRITAMDFSRVQDAHGNRWTDFEDIGEHYKPYFLVESGVPNAFAIVNKPVVEGATEGSLQFKVTYEMNYPIDREKLFGFDPVVEPAKLNKVSLLAAGFALSGNAEITAVTAAEAGAGRKLILTINLKDEGVGISNLVEGDAFTAPDFYPVTTQFLPDSEAVNPDGDAVPTVVQSFMRIMPVQFAGFEAGSNSFKATYRMNYAIDTTHFGFVDNNNISAAEFSAAGFTLTGAVAVASAKVSYPESNKMELVVSLSTPLEYGVEFDTPNLKADVSLFLLSDVYDPDINPLNSKDEKPVVYFARVAAPTTTSFIAESMSFSVVYAMNYEIDDQTLFGLSISTNSLVPTVITAVDLANAGFMLSGSATVDDAEVWLSNSDYTLNVKVNLDEDPANLGSNKSLLAAGDYFRAPLISARNKVANDEPVNPDVNPLTGADNKPIATP